MRGVPEWGCGRWGGVQAGQAAPAWWQKLGKAAGDSPILCSSPSQARAKYFMPVFCLSMETCPSRAALQHMSVPMASRADPAAPVPSSPPKCAEVNMPDVGTWLVDSKGRLTMSVPPVVYYQMDVRGA